ncbi:unnamed protein product [Discula destructiva]
MEPRARAGKNVGKMNFSYQELTQFLIAHGDSRQPLQETMKVIDEIVTEFVQGVSFEAARIAKSGGRQKVKYEDFQFAMRKNPFFLGKAAENKELREALEKQRKMFDEDEYTKDDVAAAAGAGSRGRKRKAPGGPAVEATNGSGSKPADGAGLDEEELGDADDEEVDQLVAPPARRA